MITHQTPLVAYIEDDEDDQELCQLALEGTDVTASLHFISDGQSALDYLASLTVEDASQQKPSLVMLDLNMPAINGWDILQALRNNPNLKCLPVVVFTTSISPRDREQAYRMGANAYTVKPAGLRELGECLSITIKYWTECVVH